MDEIESKPLTHTCEFVGMDFHMRLNTLQGFSHFAYKGLDPILKTFEQQRLQARKRDDEQMGPLEEDEDYWTVTSQ